MTIKYKVVKNRRSCIISPRTKYCLRYIKGRTIRARPETLGIMVFETKEQTRSFMLSNHLWKQTGVDVIEVKPVGRKLKLKLISVIEYGYETEILNKFYRYPLEYGHHNFPDGTQCYPAVKVLT